MKARQSDRSLDSFYRTLGHRARTLLNKAERQAVALERKALPLERHTQRIEMPERQRAEFSFEALDDLLARQRLDRGHAHDRGDHLVAQRTRPSAFMADLDQQADHALFAPRVGPVVDRLSAHTEFRTDG